MSLRPAWVTERDVSQTGSQEEPTREERGSSLDRGGWERTQDMKEVRVWGTPGK